MEVTIALGHFCDTHGPCVILCTDRISKIPENVHSLNVFICDACQSLDLNTVYSCKDEDSYYISTRMPFNKNVTNILKDAVLRSLSVEVVQEEGYDSGIMYFGDNERGHIISHVFDLKDTLARGFKRKYCIVVYGKHQIPLLNHYHFIEKNLKKISTELQEKAAKVNTAEQSEKSQREMRQSKECGKLRSLPHLVGEEHVFGHLHMWFVFLLRSKIYKNIPHTVWENPISCPTIGRLREFNFEMPKLVFETISYCILTGITVIEEDVDIIKHFQQLLPKKFVLPTGGKYCRVCKRDGWQIFFEGTLPKNFPKLYYSIKIILENRNISELTLQYQVMSLIMRWFNIACVLSWAPNKCDDLLHSLEVQKCDMPLLSYWIPQSNACVELYNTDEWLHKYTIENL